MSNHPVPRPVYHPYHPSRSTERRIEAAHSRGAEAAARIQGAAFATDVALMHLDRFHQIEVESLKRSAVGADRVKALADAYTAVAYGEIMALGWS